jgi:uncharacterized membrane protein
MNFEPILNAGFAIQIHLVAALGALAAGAAIFASPKGTAAHKTLGWTYATFMAAAAISAIFIRRTHGIPNIAGFTPIHLFVILTAIGLPRALLLIRSGNVAGHKRAMISLYVGAIIIAGVLAFLPGRILNRALFGG